MNWYKTAMGEEIPSPQNTALNQSYEALFYLANTVLGIDATTLRQTLISYQSNQGDAEAQEMIKQIAEKFLESSQDIPTDAKTQLVANLSQAIFAWMTAMTQ